MTWNDNSSGASIHTWRERLACRERQALSPSDFNLTDLLYRGFRMDDLDDEGVLDAESLRFPDLSCNWDRFSIPHDVRYRKPKCENDGCYAITVDVARFKSFATPVHYPLCNQEPENYSHVEIRELYEAESVTSTPPRNRKNRNKRSKVLRLEWRVNVVINLQRLIEPIN